MRRRPTSCTLTDTLLRYTTRVRCAKAESLGGSIPKEDRDLLDVLIAGCYDAEMVTGIFISLMCAGQHTSSGTASWAMIELLRNREVMNGVVDELDELYAPDADGTAAEVSLQALR